MEWHNDIIREVLVITDRFAREFGKAGVDNAILETKERAEKIAKIYGWKDYYVSEMYSPDPYLSEYVVEYPDKRRYITWEDVYLPCRYQVILRKK